MFKNSHIETLRPTAEFELQEGDLYYMEEVEKYHSLSNKSIARAISLHIYANTIDKCEVYNEADKCFEKKYVFYVN